jgi:hypothetical protein
MTPEWRGNLDAGLHDLDAAPSLDLSRACHPCEPGIRPRRRLAAMRNRWAGSFGRVARSDACSRRGHDDCSHLIGVAGMEVFWWRSAKFGAVLCKCECHSSCPITVPAE